MGLRNELNKKSKLEFNKKKEGKEISKEIIEKIINNITIHHKDNLNKQIEDTEDNINYMKDGKTNLSDQIDGKTNLSDHRDGKTNISDQMDGKIEMSKRRTASFFFKGEKK